MRLTFLLDNNLGNPYSGFQLWNAKTNTFQFSCQGLLFPQDSETRETKSLDGLWDFRLSPKYAPDIGFREEWYKKMLQSNLDELDDPDEVWTMPVPSSFNDITPNATVRDFVGWAWYQREFFVPNSWQTDVEVRIRFGSAHYIAIGMEKFLLVKIYHWATFSTTILFQVWVNGQMVGNHTGGHLPFEFNVTNVLQYTGINTVTVAVNNTLTPVSIPQGQYVWHNDSKMYPPGEKIV